jgi:hypothetical protein
MLQMRQSGLRSSVERYRISVSEVLKLSPTEMVIHKDLDCSNDVSVVPGAIGNPYNT